MAEQTEDHAIGRRHTTRSGIPLRPYYATEAIPDGVRAALAKAPGEPPFLRGAYREMYRAKPWRIFQISGYGSPEQLNQRLRFLLDNGETGIIMKRDRVTNDHLYDVDDPAVIARKEDVGQTGCVLLSARDVGVAIDGIPPAKTYVHPGAGVVQAAPFCVTSYWVAAMRQGAQLHELQGTGQSDFFLTYVGCLTDRQIPPRAGLRLNCDLIEFCTERMPRWVPVSVAGYNGADSGLNAFQELGAVFANSIEYLDGVAARGRHRIEDFGKGVAGISLRSSMELFEDAAKLRAARKLWSDLLEHRYGVRDERVRRLRIHVVTAGSAMTYQQPFNNIVRGTLMALGAVLGGTQSLGVSGYDEALAIPSDHAHQMSLRIQQILQNELHLTDVADPLGGSYYVESLTAELEERALAFMGEIEAQGGFIESIDSGWLQQQAIRNLNEEARLIESGDVRVVGVNAYTDDVRTFDIDGFAGGSDAWDRAMRRVRELRMAREERRCATALRELERACRTDGINVIPPLIEAVAADATVGEIGSVFRAAFGEWDVPGPMKGL